MTDANGNVTKYTYDRNDRKTREDRPSVAGTTAVRRVQYYFYDAADRLVREVTKSATGGEDRAINYQYDPLDRLIRKIVQREGASNVVEDDSSFSYEDQVDATLLKTAVNGVATLGFSNGTCPPPNSHFNEFVGLKPSLELGKIRHRPLSKQHFRDQVK